MKKNNNWKPMKEAPRTYRPYIEVQLEDGKIETVHYACDLSGEEQPPFEGWFKNMGSWNMEVEPITWREIEAKKELEG